MMTMLLSWMKSAGAWMQANPNATGAILIGLVATLANTLGRFPKAAGVVGFLRKAVDLLSPLTHSASPGTLKMPVATLTRKADGSFGLAWSFSADPTASAASQPAKSQGGFVRIGVLATIAAVGVFCAVLGIAMMGCTTPAQKAQLSAFEACMEAKGIAAGQGAAGSVESDVGKWLTSGLDKSTIVGQLEGLAGQAGLDATICAVQSWLNPGSRGRRAALPSTGVAAAETFLGKHGVSARARQTVAINAPSWATSTTDLVTSGDVVYNVGTTGVFMTSEVPSVESAPTAVEIAAAPAGRCPVCVRNHEKSTVSEHHESVVFSNATFTFQRESEYWDEDGVHHDAVYAPPPPPTYTYRCSRGHSWSQHAPLGDARIARTAAPSTGDSFSASLIRAILSDGAAPPPEMPLRIDVQPLE